MVVWLPGWLQKWPGNVLYDGGLGDLEGLIPWKNRNLGKAPKICGDWRCNLQSSWPWHYFLILWQKIMKCLYFLRSVQLIFSVHLHFIPIVARCILSYQCLTFSYFHHFQIFIFSGDLSGGQICTSFIAVARSMTKLSVTLTFDIHIVPITKLQQRSLEVQVLKFWGSIHSSIRCGTPNIYHYM